MVSVASQQNLIYTSALLEIHLQGSGGMQNQTRSPRHSHGRELMGSISDRICPLLCIGGCMFKIIHTSYPYLHRAFCPGQNLLPI